MSTEIYMVFILLISGAVLIWNQYEYLRIMRSRTGQSSPVVGSDLTVYLLRPRRLWSAFGRLVRVGSAHQTDPLVEAARQRFLQRRYWVLLGFGLAAVAGLVRGQP